MKGRSGQAKKKKIFNSESWVSEGCWWKSWKPERLLRDRLVESGEHIKVKRGEGGVLGETPRAEEATLLPFDPSMRHTCCGVHQALMFAPNKSNTTVSIVDSTNNSCFKAFTTVHKRQSTTACAFKRIIMTTIVLWQSNKTLINNQTRIRIRISAGRNKLKLSVLNTV